MITRQKYLEALTIVEAYHEQLNLSIVMHCVDNKYNIDVSEKGSYLLCEGKESNTKYLTIGKKYKITGKKIGWYVGDKEHVCIQIINDVGKYFWIKQNIKNHWSCT
jgi:hypothetical protein